jgi:hypothetical protein
MLQDEFPKTTSPAGLSGILEKLAALHDDLKKVLGSIISDTMAARISLNSGDL